MNPINGSLLTHPCKESQLSSEGQDRHEYVIISPQILLDCTLSKQPAWPKGLEELLYYSFPQTGFILHFCTNRLKQNQ